MFQISSSEWVVPHAGMAVIYQSSQSSGTQYTFPGAAVQLRHEGRRRVAGALGVVGLGIEITARRDDQGTRTNPCAAKLLST